MRLAFTIGTCLLAATTTAACLLDDDDGDGSDYVAPNEIAAAYKDAQCQFLASCGLFPTRDACLMAQAPAPTGYLIEPNVEAAIYAGHVIYNGSNVKACIDAVAAQSCDRTDASVRAFVPECYAFFRGTLAAGELCYVDEECISQRCTGDVGGDVCQPGTCVGDTPPVVAVGQIGEDCSSVSRCVDGAYCDTVTGLCTALKTSGTACTVDSECDYGLGCRGTTGARTCAALPAIGQPCATDGVCRDTGAYCDFSLDACQMYLLEGAQCGTSGVQCSPYYPCDFNVTPAVCARGPGLGEPCGGSNNCFDAGTFCNFNVSPAVCAQLKPDGSPCGNSLECESGVCNFQDQTCGSPPSCF